MNQPLIIDCEFTPNPNTIKFCPVDLLVSPGRIVEFDQNSKIVNSALARDLLSLSYVTIVFFGHDFISISKTNDVEWQEIKSEIIFTILRYEEDLVKNTLIEDSNEVGDDDDDIEFDEKDRETVLEIIEFLNDEIRPKLAMDGGDILLKAYKDGIAYLKLRGACTSCPSAGITLYQGVRELLIGNISDLIDIEQV